MRLYAEEPALPELQRLAAAEFDAGRHRRRPRHDRQRRARRDRAGARRAAAPRGPRRRRGPRLPRRDRPLPRARAGAGAGGRRRARHAPGGARAGAGRRRRRPLVTHPARPEPDGRVRSTTVARGRCAPCSPRAAARARIEDDHLGPVVDAPRITVTAGRERWAAARSVVEVARPGPARRPARRRRADDRARRGPAAARAPVGQPHPAAAGRRALDRRARSLAGHVPRPQGLPRAAPGLVAALAGHGHRGRGADRPQRLDPRARRGRRRPRAGR